MTLIFLIGQIFSMFNALKVQLKIDWNFTKSSWNIRVLIAYNPTTFVKQQFSLYNFYHLNPCFKVFIHLSYIHIFSAFMTLNFHILSEMYKSIFILKCFVSLYMYFLKYDKFTRYTAVMMSSVRENVQMEFDITMWTKLGNLIFWV